MANIFRVFLTFFETYSNKIFKESWKKEKNMLYFLSDWIITCLSSMHKIYETNKLNSRSQQRRQQKGATKKE